MIFNMVGAGGNKVPITPIYTGVMNCVVFDDGKSGYAEFLTSGELSWAGGIVPETVDMFAVGGGGGGGTNMTPSGYTRCGGGGGGGYTTTVLGVELEQETEIIIGAGGTGGTGSSTSDAKAGTDGGTTSIGEFCIAAGGKAPVKADSDYFSKGGDGGSGGGTGGWTGSSLRYNGGDGGSDGADGVSRDPNYTEVGKGQGSSTADLLGRVHAGGGGGGAGSYYSPTSQKTTYGEGGDGGASDFENGSGGGARTSTAGLNVCKATGGGGYGGGGAGGPDNDGGQGFAMIAWGDYLENYNNMDEIIELQYIESTGEQHIDTEYYPKNDTRVVMDVSDVPNTTTAYLFGMQTSTSSSGASYPRFQLYRRWFNSSDSIYMTCGGNSATDGLDDTMLRTTVDMNGNTATAWGVTVTATAPAAFTGQYPLYLFAYNGAGVSAGGQVSMRLYSCQIYDAGNILVRDYVPARTKAGSVGLYDRLNGVFYKNKGTGLFIAGPKAKEETA